MKKQIFISILLSLVVIIALIIAIYGFFYEEVEIIISSLLIIVGSLVMGFMLNSYFLDKKFRIDDTVLHLTKEILHEITIPISTIQANTLLLKRGVQQDEKLLKRLRRIDDASKRLERLYEELHYSIKKEIYTVERERFYLDSVVQERVEVMKLLNRNNFNLKLEALEIKADKIGFEKVLDNIIENAMKYSSKESLIHIELKGHLLTISDKGVGMSSEELVHIHKRYYQANKEQKGQGIGLALVYAYTSKEKIKVEISSKKAKGTKVSFNLEKVLV